MLQEVRGVFGGYEVDGSHRDQGESARHIEGGITGRMRFGVVH